MTRRLRINFVLYRMIHDVVLKDLQSHSEMITAALQATLTDEPDKISPNVRDNTAYKIGQQLIVAVLSQKVYYSYVTVRDKTHLRPSALHFSAPASSILVLFLSYPINLAINKLY